MAKASTTNAVAAGSETARRIEQLAGKNFAGKGVALAAMAPADRISLRAPAASLATLSKALGVKLPQNPKTSASANGRTALWLGPDEWLVIDEAGNDPLVDCAAAPALHSAVGVSHRNVGILVSGPRAAVVVNAGCPQDLSLGAFPVGACSRTVLGKIEIVLLRTAADAFRIECWRSFSDYAYTFLSEAASDPAA